MKNAIFSKFTLLILAVSMSGLVACSQGDRTTVRTATSSGGTGSGTVGGSGGNLGSGTCPGTNTVGKIYDPAGAASTTFDSQVRAFVSATLDPSQLGSVSGDIDGTTGIDFTASFSFNSGGQINTASSSVSIKIYDSFVGSVSGGQTIQPYLVNFNTASTGSYNSSSGSFQVTFSDAYGDITFQGQRGTSISQGTVTFRNKTAVAGYSAASGTLGSFKVYNCSLFK